MSRGQRICLTTYHPRPPAELLITSPFTLFTPNTPSFSSTADAVGGRRAESHSELCASHFFLTSGISSTGRILMRGPAQKITALQVHHNPMPISSQSSMRSRIRSYTRLLTGQDDGVMQLDLMSALEGIVSRRGYSNG